MSVIAETTRAWERICPAFVVFLQRGGGVESESRRLLFSALQCSFQYRITLPIGALSRILRLALPQRGMESQTNDPCLVSLRISVTAETTRRPPDLLHPLCRREILKLQKQLAEEQIASDLIVDLLKKETAALEDEQVSSA